ncbi:MAG: hypothetical protein V3U76_14585 [Granulosicoccus sp.]
MSIHHWLLLASLCLSGCEALDEAFDCLDNDVPEFRDSTLLPGVLNQVYGDTIRIGINNDAFDEWYNYRVELTGELPPGILFRREQLRLYFEGTPLAVGDFEFTLRLEVLPGSSRDQEDIDSLCRTVEFGNYVIRVSDN